MLDHDDLPLGHHRQGMTVGRAEDYSGPNRGPM